MTRVTISRAKREAVRAMLRSGVRRHELIRLVGITGHQATTISRQVPK